MFNMRKIVGAVFLTLLLVGSKANAQLAIIVNKSVPVTTASPSTIQAIFSLDMQKWPDGSRIVLFNLKEKSDTKKQFHNLLGRKSTELRKLWIRYELTGEGEAPRAVESIDDMIRKVTETPGAIGYISTHRVTDAVKVILTNK